MPKVFKYILFLGLIINGLSVVKAQKVSADQRTITKVEIPEKHLDKYHQDKAFDYVIKAKPENVFTKMLNWLKKEFYRLLIKFFSWLLGPKHAGNVVNFIVKALPYIAVLIFAYLIFRFLIGADLISLGQNKVMPKSKVLNLNDEQIIKEADLDSLISEAVNDKDYRLAIRYYYLKILKQLIDNQLIDWHPDKTNRDYVNELKSKDLKHLFKHLTFIYDFVWYGKFTPAEEDFISIKDDFNKFAAQ